MDVDVDLAVLIGFADVDDDLCFVVALAFEEIFDARPLASDAATAEGVIVVDGLTGSKHDSFPHFVLQNREGQPVGDFFAGGDSVVGVEAHAAQHPCALDGAVQGNARGVEGFSAAQRRCVPSQQIEAAADLGDKRRTRRLADHTFEVGLKPLELVGLGVSKGQPQRGDFWRIWIDDLRRLFRGVTRRFFSLLLRREFDFAGGTRVFGVDGQRGNGGRARWRRRRRRFRRCLRKHRAAARRGDEDRGQQEVDGLHALFLEQPPRQPQV